MNLELLQHHPAKHVPAHSILDYEAFSEGYHTYLNPFFKSDDQDSTFEADACGIKGGEILVAFCATGFPEKQVWNAIGIVSKSENARALIVSPQEIDRETIEGQAP